MEWFVSMQFVHGDNKRGLLWPALSCFGHVRLSETLQTVAHQASLTMGFSRQECWSGLPFSSPGDLPDPGIESGSPALQADSLLSEPPGRPIILKRDFGGLEIFHFDSSPSKTSLFSGLV